MGHAKSETPSRKTVSGTEWLGLFARLSSKRHIDVHSSGTVRDLHPIPFLISMMNQLLMQS